ncbi:hypothetical protein CONLIGDRAFT_637982 [Coniochaeta ligniaria NRRL 30616]|uniref:F-box domain-containing protein n=1 Tax=Coniochaeta ligniaria NRRL 30616 TaxID=1408157 RepID=A0A1J7I6R2_9PEZI|nr:hypothetical protein CONLIGDRAFT_637982 [Coniochaeta ligniaria NRRL 30616]
MAISNIPGEILSAILAQLLEYQDYDDPKSHIYYGYLRDARLVCRRWNEFATAHLFRTLTLDVARENATMSWKGIINSGMIQQAARDIVICSHLSDAERDMGSDGEDWCDHDSSLYFSDAVRGIAKLPNLNSLQICFAKKCLGAREYRWWEEDEDTEPIWQRLQVLRAVFRAIRTRHAAVGRDNLPSAIRSLTLKNLQNIPIPQFTASELYKDVMKHVNELHLLIAHEFNEHGPDHDLDRLERQTYEPHLQRELLPPLAHQLRSLTLTFRECWGVIPGYFDGDGLVFPNLRTLTLGEFVIGHHNQFDWVLAQKSLETLRLDRCCIVSYLRVCDDDQWDRWHVPAHDWYEYPKGSFGFDDNGRTFGFSGTWETVYDRVREGLPELREFCSVHHRWSNTFDRRENMGASMSALRYITFDSGLCPSPWIEARYGPYGTGDMEFGNNDPAVCPSDATDRQRYTPEKPLNRAKETELGDRRAFEELLRAVWERR